MRRFMQRRFAVAVALVVAAGLLIGGTAFLANRESSTVNSLVAQPIVLRTDHSAVVVTLNDREQWEDAVPPRGGRPFGAAPGGVVAKRCHRHRGVLVFTVFDRSPKDEVSDQRLLRRVREQLAWFEVAGMRAVCRHEVISAAITGAAHPVQGTEVDTFAYMPNGKSQFTVEHIVPLEHQVVYVTFVGELERTPGIKAGPLEPRFPIAQILQTHGAARQRICDVMAKCTFCP